MEFNFEILVNEAYETLDQKYNGNMLILPEIIVEINKVRLHWKNVKNYLRIINRHPDHFIDWLKSERPGYELNWYSGSKADGLIIHGKRQRKSDISDLALKYVNNYVICSSCAQVNTVMIKTVSKQYLFECLICGMKKNIT
jgi:translation initiation factor 2 beta subunit (eIF-2beta)/eIF-5